MAEPVTAAELAEALRKLTYAWLDSGSFSELSWLSSLLGVSERILARYDAQQTDSSKPVTPPDSHWNDDDEYVTSDGLTISHQFTDIADLIAISINGDHVVGIDMRDFAEVARMFCWPKQAEESKHESRATSKNPGAADPSREHSAQAAEFALPLPEAIRGSAAFALGFAEGVRSATATTTDQDRAIIRCALNVLRAWDEWVYCRAPQVESSKPALSEVEQATVKAIEAYNASNGEGGDACDYAMFTLREALRKRGAL